MTTTHARWAILGAGDISGYFARSLRYAELGRLHAVAARDGGAARAFADMHGAEVAGTYDEVLARDDVDAVYIGTVHTTHLQLVTDALAAGKAVLCEKPLGVTPAETDAAIAAAADAGLPLLEAFKYRFGPFAELLRETVVSGAIGEVTAVESAVGFAASAKTGRLFDPATAGGAILDVGCYPVSLAVGLAAWTGRRLRGARVVQTMGSIGETGVDETASAVLEIDGLVARVRTSIVTDLPDATTITGTRGSFEIPDVWGSRDRSGDGAVLRTADGTERELRAGNTVAPMAAEADAVIRALRDGRTEVPEMPWEQSRVTARLLADWRVALD